MPSYLVERTFSGERATAADSGAQAHGRVDARNADVPEGGDQHRWP